MKVDGPWMSNKDAAAASAQFKAVLESELARLETRPKAPDAIKTIDAAETLFWLFWSLIGLSMLLYAAGRLMASSWDAWDFVRVLNPAFAFVAWTMIQKATAFDGVLLHETWTYSDPARSAPAIIGAIVLGVAASALAYKADQKKPK